MRKQGLTPDLSSALHGQSPTMYPCEWRGRVPRQVRMVRTVRPMLNNRPVAICGTIFDVFVSWTGLVILLFATGETLCVATDAFVVVQWHERGAA